MKTQYMLCIFLGILAIGALAQDDDDEIVTVEEDIAKVKKGSKTDDETVEREAEGIKLDGLSVAQMKEIREGGEKKVFQAEVSRMMNLIINSLYRNKEIFLRELISNASDALDKIRLYSLTDSDALGAIPELVIKIKLDKDNNMLHITDTGIGMTGDELTKNLGTIAKSGTSDFFEKMQQSSGEQASDLIGQFGVGFYSSFLVADTVIVTSKSNDEATQHIWTSDSGSFSIADDPRGNTLGRGTTISLVMKEESAEYLQLHTVKELINKYSQFINFPIYIWESKEEDTDEPLSEEEDAERLEKLEALKAKKEKSEEAGEEDDEEDVSVEEDDVVLDEDIEELEKTTKKVKTTVWDWRQVNENKPIWLKKQSEVEDGEYDEFYKAISKDHEGPLCKTHFVAEGEVTFRSLLYVPKSLPSGMFQDYGKKSDQIKMYVRRVFISDDFTDMMPKYLSFVRGVVDSDDLPLNVSRETLQQHKLLKVIKKKLVRKVLDMVKKMDDEQFKVFWKEYGTNMKLGVMEDTSNRSRLSKLLRFQSSNSEEDLTSLEDYVERMKDKQENIFFVSGTARPELEKSPFVEKLLKDGYEVLYLVDPVDEYTMQSLPEFDGKRFQNAAKDGLELPESEKRKEHWKQVEEETKPLTDFLKTKLEDVVDKVQISKRLDKTPCVLVSSKYGWSANMERIMRSQAYQKAQDPNRMHQLSQKKTLEINPRHPLIKKLDAVRQEDEEQATDLAKLIYKSARVASGFSLEDPTDFVDTIYGMLSKNLGIENEEMEEDTFVDDEEEGEAEDEEEVEAEEEYEEEDYEGEEQDDTVDKDEL